MIFSSFAFACFSGWTLISPDLESFDQPTYVLAGSFIRHGGLLASGFLLAWHLMCLL
tara:strand:+ start:57 stop:227 length:171 start_codon:yes stop_codon:yes gene_type:complete